MGWAVVGTGVFFGLALGLLGAFFVTNNARFDRAAEWSFIAFGILAVPAILEVDRHLPAGPAATVFAVLGIAGAVGLGLGELASALRVLDFRRISLAMTLAFVAFLAWIGGASLLSLGGGGVPTSIAWLGVAAIAIAVGMLLLIARQPGVMQGESEPGKPQMAAMLLSMAGIVAWLVWLGISL
jgi:hypothetical protein